MARAVDDDARVAVLRELHLLDAPRTAEFAALARLAAYICGTPTAAVNLIDSDRQWQAGAFGVEPGEVTREESMCARNLHSAQVTYTPDASQHELFRDNPFVTGEIADVRLYVSAPLVVSEHVVGTLCAFAPQPGTLDDRQLSRLEDLAFAAGKFLELRRTAGDLANAAIRDPLTGLHNRSVFRDALDRAFARRARSLTRPGLVFVDLNAFKPVNDTYGHAAGDLVLRELATRLLDSVRSTDLVVRLGGDEFVIVVEEAFAPRAAEAGIAQVVHRLREAMTRPFPITEGRSITLSAAVGWTLADDSDTPETLLHRADEAMYADKAVHHAVDRAARRATH